MVRTTSSKCLVIIALATTLSVTNGQYPNYNPSYTPGYNTLGYNTPGYNTGYNTGYNMPGYNALGYNTPGYNTLGYNTPGYNTPGYNTLGYNGQGLNGYAPNNGLFNGPGGYYGYRSSASLREVGLLTSLVGLVTTAWVTL